jgi:hypothetical protein
VKVPFIAQVESNVSLGDEKFQNLPCCTGKYPVKTSALASTVNKNTIEQRTIIAPITLLLRISSSLDLLFPFSLFPCHILDP